MLQVLDEAPLAQPQLLDLAAFVADHYLAPPGECYRLVLPPAGVRASRAVVRLLKPGGADDPLLRHLQSGPLRLTALEKRLGSDPQARLARLRREGTVAVEQSIDAPGFRERQVVVLEQAAAEPRGKAQAELVARLRAAGGRARVVELVRDRPSLRGAIHGLARKGVLRLVAERDLRSPDGLAPREAVTVVPTADQERALGELLPAVTAGAFSPFLLHGVTGSGKTEVYFRAVEAALAGGRGAILLVPEIGLTPMLVRAARARFGATVSVLHSELAAGERHDEWWRIREGEARVVVGARSAVFAPVPELGLVVVDEEHDGVLQAGREPALPRARRGRDARAARGLPGGAGLGDAVGRVVREREERQVPRAAAAAARRPRRAAAGRDRGPAGRCCAPAASRS